VSNLIRQKARRVRVLSLQLMKNIDKLYPHSIIELANNIIDDACHSPLEEDITSLNDILAIVNKAIPKAN